MKFRNSDSVFLIGNPEFIPSLTGYFTEAENKPRKINQEKLAKY